MPYVNTPMGAGEKYTNPGTPPAVTPGQTSGYTAGATVAHVDGNFTGGVGSTSYTLGAVVQLLKLRGAIPM